MAAGTSASVHSVGQAPRKRSLRVQARFFLRIGQLGRATESRRCPYTGELFGIMDYLECEGMLARDLVPEHRLEELREDGR